MINQNMILDKYGMIKGSIYIDTNHLFWWYVRMYNVYPHVSRMDRSETSRWAEDSLMENSLKTIY